MSGFTEFCRIGVLCGLVGCSGSPEAPVVARDASVARPAIAHVGGAPLYQADVELYRLRVKTGTPDEAVAGVAEDARLWQRAREAGLQNLPEIQAQLIAAERRILGDAWLTHQLDEAMTPEVVEAAYQARKHTLQKTIVHVRHLTLRFKSDPRDKTQIMNALAVRNQATTLYARLKAGEDFQTLVAAEFEGEPLAVRDGRVRSIKEGTVDAAFFEAAKSLKAGELAKPVETPFGIHIIQAARDPEVITPSLDDIRAQLSAELRQARRAELISQLKADMPIQMTGERGVGRSNANEGAQQ